MARISTAGYHAILEGIGAPVNGSTMRACVIWQRAEGGDARHNPFNTTLPMPGATDYNSFGPHGEYHVRNYVSERQGVEATIRTLLQSNFRGIVQAFRHGKSGLVVCQAVDASPWGTHHAADLYRKEYPPGT